MSSTATYQRRKLEGLCPYCGAERDRAPKQACSSCAAKLAHNSKTSNRGQYERRDAAGRCVVCGHERDDDKKVCRSCRAVSAAHYRKTYPELRAANTCTRCRKVTTDGGALCPSCLVTNRERNSRPEAIARRRELYQGIREQVFGRYGWSCACCGEDEPLFLTIDHINNDGSAHRKEIGGISKVYRWLVDNGFPEGFQTLCWNCNVGKQRNGGTCPHLSLKRKAA